MIDFSKPIETTAGEPAKLVYTSEENTNHGYLVVWGASGLNCAWVDAHGTVRPDGGLFQGIRNVPEPPVKVSSDDIARVMGRWGRQISSAYVNGEEVPNAFYEDMLSTLSEKYAEAFERVGGK